ncbi:MAG: hypothetical protein WKF63_05910, partial [Thermomicrobiales bacterium]
MYPLPIPGSTSFDVVVPAPDRGAQWWAGAPSAVQNPDGSFAIAYRARHGSGEHDEVILARSDDGVNVETVATIDKRRHGAAMTERPALLRLADGRWRLYASFATPDSLHWWVGLIEADSLAGLAVNPHTIIFPGNDAVGVKDPVVRFDGKHWHAWVCQHLLDIPGEEDRMETAWSTSDDGLTWSEPIPVLR